MNLGLLALAFESFLRNIPLIFSKIHLGFIGSSEVLNNSQIFWEKSSLGKNDNMLSCTFWRIVSLDLAKFV